MYNYWLPIACLSGSVSEKKLGLPCPQDIIISNAVLMVQLACHARIFLYNTNSYLLLASVIQSGTIRNGYYVIRMQHSITEGALANQIDRNDLEQRLSCTLTG